jgi:uncharacterized protein YcfL
MKKYFISLIVLLALNACSSNEQKTNPLNTEDSTLENTIVILDQNQLKEANLKIAILEKGTASMELHLNGPKRQF